MGVQLTSQLDGAELEAGETKRTALYSLVAGVRVIAHISTALPGIATNLTWLTTGFFENYYSTQK